MKRGEGSSDSTSGARRKINSSVNAGRLLYPCRYYSPPMLRCVACGKNDVAQFGRFVEDSSISNHVSNMDAGFQRLRLAAGFGEHGAASCLGDAPNREEQLAA